MPRNADKATILKVRFRVVGVVCLQLNLVICQAYRKLAMQWHPDKFETEAEKKEAEKKFMDIASAKEVLTDTQKRAIFDQGYYHSMQANMFSSSCMSI